MKNNLFFGLAMMAIVIFATWGVISSHKITSVTYLGKGETIKFIRGGWHQDQGYLITVGKFKSFSRNPFRIGEAVYLVRKSRSDSILLNYDPLKGEK